MPDTREPFPFPKYENDDDFRGRQKENQSFQYQKPTHLAQQEDPWNRLHATATVSSASKGIYLCNPKAPKDSLDIHLNAIYDHSNEFLKHKNEVLLQKSTCDPQRTCMIDSSENRDKVTDMMKEALNTTRDGRSSMLLGCWLSSNELEPEEVFRRKIIKDRVQKDVCACVPEHTGTGAIYLQARSPPRLWISPTKSSIHSIDGAITSQHTAATNGGYSRKIDGGFFAI